MYERGREGRRSYNRNTWKIMADTTTKSSVSFGFSKKSETKVIKRTEDVKAEETDYITSLEGQEVKSLKPKEEKKELVIPLIKTNKWNTKEHQAVSSKQSQESSLDSVAVQELVQDAAKQQEEWAGRGDDTNSVREIPLLMQNKVPEGFETEEHLDVSLRPEEPEDTDYDEVPIEAFGMAMLRGMGWKEGQGIGKNNKSVAPVEAVLRPKGMGLGADRKQTQALNDTKQGGKAKDEDREDLSMKKGAFCLIEKGPYKDLYAVIEGMDEDNARLMVKLTISGKTITVSQYNTRLVTSKEYNKYSKYINKGAADRYTEKEHRKKEKEKEKNSSDYHQSDRETERRHRKEEDRLSSHDYREVTDRQREKHERKRDKYRDDDYDRSSKKRKYDDDRPDSRSSSHNSTSSGAINGSSHSILWVRPKIRVRVVSEKYKKGKYYNTKVTIIDVMDKDHCVCKTDDGKVLEDLSQSMLETVVPKKDLSYVSIVSGKYQGQIAHVLERDKRKCEAMVQLLSNRDKVLKLDYDSVCEYTGDVNEEFDF